MPKVIQMGKNTKTVEQTTVITYWKITVIKTLAIPIFNLLFTSLPNPDVKTYETINKTLYDFLWFKNPKIKIKSCEKEIYRRGLNMINSK